MLGNESLRAACNLRQAGAISRASSYRTLELLPGLPEAAEPDGAVKTRLSATSLAEIELADQTEVALQRHCQPTWLRRYILQPQPATG